MAEEDKRTTLIPHSQVGSRVRDSVPVSGTLRMPGMEVGFSLPKMLEALPTPIVVIDEQARILVANAAARELLCPGSLAFVGYCLHRFLSSEKLEQAALACEQQDLTPQVFRDRVLASGVERDLEVTLGAFVSSARRYFALSLVDRSDDERRNEEAAFSGPDSGRGMARLERSYQLEALGHLAGTFAHDFNNLLSVILGSLQSAERRLSRGEDVASDLGRAITATERSIETTARVLHFTRSRSAAPETSSPSEALRELQTLLVRAVGSGVSLNIHVEETPDVAISAVQLETAVLNLVINARDAVGESGSIDVALTPRDVSEEASLTLGISPGMYVSILVQDSGSGMDEDVKRQAFEPFYTTKPVGSGTGLGLSTVRSLMTKLGGAVLLDSTAGEGTRVELLLPTTSNFR